MSTACFNELSGTVVGPSGSAIVGGTPRPWEANSVPLPPPPPNMERVVGIVGFVPAPVPKVRPGKPSQPSFPPPDGLVAKAESLLDVKVELVDDEVPGPEWLFESDPAPPSLTAADRPIFIACLKEWLEGNLSKNELRSLVD